MKIRAKDLTGDQKNETLRALDQAALALTDGKSIKLFLNDLLTESERLMLGRRILIARRIMTGDTSRAIASEMKVGLDTVFKIEKWLDKKFPGYEDVANHLEKEGEKRKQKRDADMIWKNLKRKYPLHFLFFPD